MADKYMELRVALEATNVQSSGLEVNLSVYVRQANSRGTRRGYHASEV